MSLSRNPNQRSNLNNIVTRMESPNFMWVLFMGVPLTLEAVLVAIAEASHHMSLMNLCLILMSKCINDDVDDDDDQKDVKL